MQNIEENAISSFRAGLNCSQAVVAAFAEKLGFDKELVLRVSAGFGGGMGRLQETCGAVTGAFMVLGMSNSKKYGDNLDLKNATYQMIRQFDTKFKSIHSTTNCKALLQCDLSSEEGHTYAVEHKLFEQVCEKCIADAVNIVEELIAE